MDLPHWPSLPPIRTSSSSNHRSKVSCETLDASSASATASAAHNTQSPHPNPAPTKHRLLEEAPPPPSPDTLHSPTLAARSAAASAEPPLQRLWLLRCFSTAPAIARKEAGKAQRSDPLLRRAPPVVGGGGCSWRYRTSRSPPPSAKALTAGRRLRSLIGLPGSSIPQYSSAMAHFSGPLQNHAAVSASYGGGISPVAMSPTSGRGAISPSSRNNNSRTAGSGRRAQQGFFTMIPPEFAGRKKPPQGYETVDEPTSPHVTCMGRVRRQKKKKKKAAAAAAAAESGASPVGRNQPRRRRR